MAKINTKHVVLFLLVGMLLIVSACSSKDDSADDTEPSDDELDNLNKEDEFPIVNENITLDIFGVYDPASNEDWNDVFIYDEYEEMSNVDIDWDMVPQDSASEKMNLALGGGTLPDAFHSAMIDSSTLVKYGEQGVLLPLNDLIDEYAPNFKALMEEYPDIEESITMPDGNIYSFPALGDPEFLSYSTAPMLYINEEWLEEMDMDEYVEIQADAVERQVDQ